MVNKERFWRKVRKTDKCWQWTASTNKRPIPYGLFRVDGKMHGAHRVSWMLANGDIPDGLQVLHACDNSLCVNPSHLFLGTQMDNVQDAVRKGRHPRGERNGRSKLAESDIPEIRSAVMAGESMSSVARRFGVSVTVIEDIRNRKTWRFVD